MKAHIINDTSTDLINTYTYYDNTGTVFTKVLRRESCLSQARKVFESSQSDWPKQESCLINF